MHQIIFRLVLCPRPHWGSLQRSPDSLAGSKGPTSKGSGGEIRGKGSPLLFLRIYAHALNRSSSSSSGSCGSINKDQINFLPFPSNVHCTAFHCMSMNPVTFVSYFANYALSCSVLQ